VQPALGEPALAGGYHDTCKSSLEASKWQAPGICITNTDRINIYRFCITAFFNRLASLVLADCTLCLFLQRKRTVYRIRSQNT